jgi:hypothetical protein
MALSRVTANPLLDAAERRKAGILVKYLDGPETGAPELIQLPRERP